MKGNVILLAGIHGVGKSFFSEILSKEMGIQRYVASQLISYKINVDYNINKKVTDIRGNQNVLKYAMLEKGLFEKVIILEGHFCLLNNFGEIEQIPFLTFKDLNLKAIIVLTENPSIIKNRIFNRSKHNYSLEFIEKFQNMEVNYAKKVAEKLDIQIIIQNSLTVDVENIKRVLLDV